MAEHVKAESGLQLLARLTPRPNISAMAPQIFSAGALSSLDTIEIRGGPGSGKTLLITELISRCILSQNHGGMGAGVILIDTDHHFQLQRLVSVIQKNLNLGVCSSTTQHTEVQRALERLTILPCYDSSQLMVTLHALPQYLATMSHVSLLVFDTPSTFYWTDCFNDSKVSSKNKYLQNILSSVLSVGVAQQQVIFMYTMSDNFASASFQPAARAPSSVHHRISLYETGASGEQDSVYLATYRNPPNHRYLEAYFSVAEDGIHWTANVKPEKNV